MCGRVVYVVWSKKAFMADKITEGRMQWRVKIVKICTFIQLKFAQFSILSALPFTISVCSGKEAGVLDFKAQTPCVCVFDRSETN